jgi:hypothetical protein
MPGLPQDYEPDLASPFLTPAVRQALTDFVTALRDGGSGDNLPGFLASVASLAAAGNVALTRSNFAAIAEASRIVAVYMGNTSPLHDALVGTADAADFLANNIDQPSVS